MTLRSRLGAVHDRTAADRALAWRRFWSTVDGLEPAAVSIVDAAIRDHPDDGALDRLCDAAYEVAVEWQAEAGEAPDDGAWEAWSAAMDGAELPPAHLAAGAATWPASLPVPPAIGPEAEAAFLDRERARLAEHGPASPVTPPAYAAAVHLRMFAIARTIRGLHPTA